MLERIKLHQSAYFTALIGLFFILILHFKWSYSAIPILLCLVGLVAFITEIKQQGWQQIKLEPQTQWLVATFVGYFMLFVLSLIIQKGKGSELDLAARALLALPILALLAKQTLQHKGLIYSLLIASALAGVVAVIQVFGLDKPYPFPKMMHIQAGDISMSLAVFSLCALFYFYAQKKPFWVILSLIAALLGILASFLNTARGAWIGVPFVLIVIFWLNRQHFSKWILLAVSLIVVIGGGLTGNLIKQRVVDAQNEVVAYVDNNNGSTSVGARFDMWKSALIGIQEKPLFGWGLQGVKEMRKQHFAEGKISKYASEFDHAHNQYLQDASARGLLGFTALLGVFFVPMVILWRNARRDHALAHFWGVVGISHILLAMSYSLTQSFLSHTSGAMFYFVGVIFFIGLQKNALKTPLA